jgi:hypothetical protein
MHSEPRGSLWRAGGQLGGQGACATCFNACGSGGVLGSTPLRLTWTLEGFGEAACALPWVTRGAYVPCWLVDRGGRVTGECQWQHHQER